MKKIIGIIFAAILCAVTTLSFLPTDTKAAELRTHDISQIEFDLRNDYLPIFYMDKNEKVKDESKYVYSYCSGLYETINAMTPESDGRYYLYVPLNGHTIGTVYEMEIPDNVTIKFANGTIDCTGRCRAFYLYGDNVNLILDDVTIKNGNATNQAVSDWSPTDRGGAIYVDGAYCSIIGRNGSIIRDSSSSYTGGGIEIDGHYCTVDNILFDNCTAQYGGAIYVYWSFSKIKDCAFRKNCKGSNGGNYVYADHGNPATGIINWEGFSIYEDGTTFLRWKATAENNDFAGKCKIYANNEEWKKDYQGYESYFTGSMVSQGNLWIIIVVAAVVVLAVVALIILKKKGIIKTKQNA